MKNLILILFVCVSHSTFSQNQAPQISNLTLAITGGETLTIQYDLFDMENDDVTISLHVKNSEGTTYSINTQNATGDLDLVTPGTGKSIEWNFAGELTSSADYIVKLVAEDSGIIDIQSIVDQVDSNNLKSDLEYIEGVRHRTAGAEQLELTRDFMEQRFVDYDLNSTIQDFDFESYTGKNYIGSKGGTTDDEIVYICDAHYDSVFNSPGADDNGSGVVGFLEAARILSKYNFRKTIKFIGFDLEEPGVKGSIAYVEDIISQGEEEIAGVLNFEMIGYYTEEPNSQTVPTGFNLLFPNAYATLAEDSFRGNFIGNIGLATQGDWAAAYDNAAAMYVPDLKVITFLAPENWFIITPDLGRSDHAPFWLADYSAVQLTGTADFRNPNYHMASDTVGTLNYTFMSNVVKAAVATLAEQAEIHNSSFVEETINITISSINEAANCDFKILTNPVNDLLRLNVSNCNSNYSIVNIHDLNGKLVFEKEISKMESDINITVKDWQNGVYLLKINGGITKKIIVQH
jgi:Zn-dependent M28 family amino/carboxypeptidase